MIRRRGRGVMRRRGEGGSDKEEGRECRRRARQLQLAGMLKGGRGRERREG